MMKLFAAGILLTMSIFAMQCVPVSGFFRDRDPPGESKKLSQRYILAKEKLKDLFKQYEASTKKVKEENRVLAKYLCKAVQSLYPFLDPSMEDLLNLSDGFEKLVKMMESGSEMDLDMEDDFFAIGHDFGHNIGPVCIEIAIQEKELNNIVWEAVLRNDSYLLRKILDDREDDFLSFSPLVKLSLNELVGNQTYWNTPTKLLQRQ